MKIFKWILISPVLLLLVAILLFLVALGVTETNKAYWDYKVKKWCESDGGVTVYEKVYLTSEEYKRNVDNNDEFVIPSDKSPLAKQYDYVWKYEKVEIRKSNPKVKKSTYVTYRKSDGKVISKMINYSRVGGDLLVIDAASSFTCRNLGGISFEVNKKIFNIKG